MTVVQTGIYNGEPFVSECAHHANTNGLGKIQRAIMTYLGTAPGGFHQYNGYNQPHCSVGTRYRAARDYHPSAELLWHGPPYGVRIPAIATAVYGTADPTAAQIRVVQRAVRRLEQLGLTTCWHACTGYVDRPYRCINGNDYVMPQAVSGLYVALPWKCEHIAAQEQLIAEAAAETQARVDAMFNDPVAAVQGLLSS
jgi:hypothetical protein